jgi:hypothetical protein
MARRRREPDFAPVMALAILAGLAVVTPALTVLAEHWMGLLTVGVSILALIGIGLCCKHDAVKRPQPASLPAAHGPMPAGTSASLATSPASQAAYQPPSSWQPQSMLEKSRELHSRVSASCDVRDAPPVPENIPKSHRLTLAAQLKAIDWYQFEQIIAAIYEKRGLSVTRRGGANPDGGIDMIIERIGVQCKHWYLFSALK